MESSEEKKWKQESLPHKERRMKKWPMSHVEEEEEAWSARNSGIRRRSSEEQERKKTWLCN
ncbi:hypothetical protein F2Q69_00019629 [Brassica cretica]|uniref:Uncharacterized protein n=1 Tax=Brassica cretica TaxID=69181 RepID=A0A8S9PUM9_BRACR|nr:hypothetical protein F2Q69_00019629 [Brassica cretica]